MRGKLSKGDSVRHKSIPHLGGKVIQVENDYITVKQADGQAVTFLKKFLVLGQPEFAISAEGGLPEDIAKMRDEYIAQYQKRNTTDLWKIGGSIRQFIAFGKFLKWHDAYRGIA